MADAAGVAAAMPLEKSSEADVADSRDGAFVWIFSFWIASLLYFDPRLFALVDAAPHLMAKGAVVVFVLSLNYFWFYALYDVVMIGLALRSRRTETRDGGRSIPESTASVAILYTTRNDFRSECAESCLAIDHPGRHLFILDDSTLPEFRRRIDVWAAGRQGVTVFRRKEESGYKAGNLNHAMRRIGDEYGYFAICDADGIFPKDFVTALLPILESDERLAFVQARQEQIPLQTAGVTFAASLGYTTGAHYRHFVAPRSQRGFLMFYGHGALMRTRVWRELGGFPEIATEDLAFSALARSRGYRGAYADDVVCSEDFPDTFARYRVRAEKWIRGTSEFLLRHFPAMLRSKAVPWHEKVDVLVNALRHYQTTVMLVFLVSIGAVLPAWFAHFRYPGSFFLMPIPEGKTLWQYLTQVRYHIFWSLDFYLAMLVTIVAPFLPALIDMRKSPRRLLRYLVDSHFIFLANMVTEAGAVLTFLLTRRAVFRNTFDSAPGTATQRGFHPNHALVAVAELLAAAGFIALGWQTRNLWLFAPASALLASPLIRRSGWDDGRIRPLVAIPFALSMIILAAVTFDIFAAQVSGVSAWWSINTEHAIRYPRP